MKLEHKKRLLKIIMQPLNFFEKALTSSKVSKKQKEQFFYIWKK